MAQQVRGLSRPLPPLLTVVVIAWAALSGALYSSAVLVLSLFSKKAALRAERLWHLHLLGVSGIKVAVEGLNKIEKSGRYVFIANHQSYFDIPVILIGLDKMVRFIAKKELFTIPVFGWAMSAAGHITMDRSNARKARASITAAVAALKKGNTSLVLFPEGTRSISGEVGEFKRGSFTLAIEAGVPIVPVAISGSWDVNHKHSFRITPGTVKLIIGDPISPDTAAALDKTRLAEMVRAAIAKAMEEGKDMGSRVADTGCDL